MKYKINIKAEQDDCPVRGNASAIDPQTDLEIENEILERLDAGNVWAWASVEVQVTLESGQTGRAYLGCCSYANERDFVENSMYFDDMVREALKDAFDQVDLDRGIDRHSDRLNIRKPVLAS
jgi:hypothetical protein